MRSTIETLPEYLIPICVLLAFLVLGYAFLKLQEHYHRLRMEDLSELREADELIAELLAAERDGKHAAGS